MHTEYMLHTAYLAPPYYVGSQFGFTRHRQFFICIPSPARLSFAISNRTPSPTLLLPLFSCLPRHPTPDPGTPDSWFSDGWRVVFRTIIVHDRAIEMRGPASSSITWPMYGPPFS